jgi:hypothetical protein
MSFRHVFFAVFAGGVLLALAFGLNSARPEKKADQPGPEFVRATGKCASCHREETAAIVVQFEHSKHAAVGVTCLDCHQPMEGQEAWEHRGFTLSKHPTSKNCAQCHTTEYDQFARSRHGGPSWAAVHGKQHFSEEQLAFAEKYHPGTIDRAANKLAIIQGAGVFEKGCLGCHKIGKPNNDGSFGSCTECHGRHEASVELARTPATCGQCHMGPDHSQLEIYNESKHGVLFHAAHGRMDLSVDPKDLTTEHMSIPTCATCHMSGIDGLKVTHDTTERLSWFLFAPVSDKRPHYAKGQDDMKAVCLKCHAKGQVEKFYAESEEVVVATNEKILKAKKIIDDLRADGLLTPEPFDEKIEFLYFDLWHYYGRTAKHGAFMGGADFVQWHGNYELLHYTLKMQEEAEKIREKAKK